tara:strand:+ start:2946 stop:3839 length:894 start_codon:yes stop_codon:yes gene_type:complete
MNWQAISFDWNQVRAFLATAEEGSLSAAARALGLAQPTLGRQVSTLEARLGVTLFERAGRRLLLTQSGQDLLEHVRAMAEAATSLALTAEGRATQIQGTVRISATDVMAAYILPDIIADLCAAQPQITIEVLATNALSDLLRREADIAIRHVRPEAPDLVARLVSQDKGLIYAAPAFLRRYGHPRTPADLADLPLVGLAEPETMARELHRLGLPVSADKIRAFSQNGVFGWELVRKGVGYGVMSDTIARRTQGVSQILPDFPPIPVQNWLTTHRELHTSRRIRVVFDFLAKALRQER